MASFAKRARELVKEVVNYEPDNLPAYNEDLVRLALVEVQEHAAEADFLCRQTQQEDEDASVGDGRQGQPQTSADATAMCIHFESIARSKRLLLCYMLQRLDRLRAIRWAHGKMPPHIVPVCSKQEAEVYRQYDLLLTRFFSKTSGIGHDLTLDTLPPRDNTVLVLVVREAGAKLFSFGRLTLKEGALLRLPAHEAEPLIKDGTLQLHDRLEFL